MFTSPTHVPRFVDDAARELLTHAAEIVGHDDGLNADEGLLDAGAHEVCEAHSYPRQFALAIRRQAAYRLARACGQEPIALSDTAVLDRALATVSTYHLTRQIWLLNHAARR